MSSPQFEEMEPVSGSSILNVSPHNSIKLESVSNFRSLGGLPIGGTDGQFVIRPGVVNRSASPTNATLSDEFWLLEVLSIKTLIDFRTSWENKTISPVRKFEDNFVQYSIKKECENSQSTNAAAANGIPQIIIEKRVEKEMEEQRNGFLWRIYNRNLTADELLKLRSHCSGVIQGVYQTAPENTKLKCTAFRYLLFNDKIGAFMLMNHLNELGIIEMYKLTLLYTQEEILTILRILKNKENYPIMYFCSLGKDRTGMVTALLLSCLGVPRDIVIEDYAKSEANIMPFMDQIKRYFTRVGLSKDEFVRSHRETMVGLLSWVDDTYGSVPDYLEGIGFSKEEQHELRQNLIVSKEEYNRIVESKSNNIQDLQKKHDDYISNIQSKKSPKLFSVASPKFWRRLSFSSMDLQPPEQR
eukprot:gene956-1216_t